MEITLQPFEPFAYIVATNFKPPIWIYNRQNPHIEMPQKPVQKFKCILFSSIKREHNREQNDSRRF